MKRNIALVASLLLAAGFAFAQTITGTVTNGTTGKPAAGDEVTLLSLSQGMQEVGSSKTDAQGKFSIKAPADNKVPHMVRVTHEGVSYFARGGPLMPGATTAEVTIYDAAKKVEGIAQTVEVDRFQSDGSQLQGIALFALQNQSNPPRTLAGVETFQFALPDGATIDGGLVRGPGGQPINLQPTESGGKNRYAFDYALKPGETQFQVSYHMPYSGKASISPKPLADVQHFVVMTPQGMTFTPKNAQRFQSMPEQQGVMVATNAKPGEDLSFTITGTGVFQAEGQQAAGGAGGDGGGAMGGGGGGGENRPGGGLGAPIDSNDPLYEYRAVILGVFALVLVMGGFYVIGKSNTAGLKTAAAGVPAAVPASAAVHAPADRNSKLLDAMKDELFHLELDRQQGKISQEEYVKAKAALDETIKRAVARTNS